MFCSTVIPTIARDSLSRAVQSVLEQRSTADYEVIVVNDSGGPLSVAPWQRSHRVQVVHTRCRDKSVARNAGAAIARGEYLHFLDDDDWLVPGALDSFVELARGSDAVLLYGGAQLVDRSGTPLLRLVHNLEGNCFIQLMAGEWIPTGAYCVRADAFFGVGGYNPLMHAAEDSDLCRRLALYGDVSGTPSIVVCAAMGERNSSTDYTRLPALSRWARESILNEPCAFGRMRDSAKSSYWDGRIVRAYGTSAVWNLRRGRSFLAAGRAVSGLRGLVLAGVNLLSVDFWRAVGKRHESFAFSRVGELTSPARHSTVR
jgi:glycosyltransferase involved in cell wall biosynthesis